MKKSLIFVSSFALALGVGVAVSAHQAKAQEAKAETSTTIYYAVNTTYSVKCNVKYGTGGSDPWGTFAMTKNGETFGGKDVYTCTFTDKWDGLATMQLQQYEGDTWKSQVVPFQDTWTSPSVYNGKIYDGSWKTYTPDPEPVTPSVYKYSLNGAAGLEMTVNPSDSSEYMSAELSFVVGDELTFTKDNEAFAVNPSDANLYTKVELSNNKLVFVQNYSGRLYLNVDNAVLWAGELDSGIYLNGSFSNWDVKHAAKAIQNVNEQGVYSVEGLTLAANAEVLFIEMVKGVRNPVYKNIDSEKLTINEGVDADLYNNNLRIKAAGTYNLYFNSTNGWYSITNPSYVPDVPEEEGYYIKGTATSWRYDSDYKMTNTSQGGNLAQFMNLDAAIDDEIRVATYYTDRTPYEQWAEVGNIFDPESEYYTDFGVKEGDNFKFTKAGKYDVYAKIENEVLKFYVAEHVDSYTIELTAIKFAGKDLDGDPVALASQTAYAGSNFNPEIPGINGYVARDVYTHADCAENHKYTPSAFNADGHLYIKYTKLANYLTGDETFAGEGHGWNVDYSTLVNPHGTNIAEGTVTVPSGVDADHPMRVKVLPYVENAGEGKPGWGSVFYTMGHEKDPEFVSIDETGNFVFVKAGTYAFYINSENKVWFNGGEYAFHAKFISEVGGVCVYQGGTNLELLASKWTEMKNAYLALSEQEQNNIKAVGIDGGDSDESADERLQMVAKYSYIVHRYGTGVFEDFIWGGSYTASSIITNNTISSVEANNTMFIVIGAIFAVTLLGLTTCLVIKKRKQN